MSVDPSNKKDVDQQMTPMNVDNDKKLDICSIIPIKPGIAQNVKLFLVDPDRFVIKFNAPKKLGNMFPLYYDIIINDIIFSKVVIQQKPQKLNKNKKVSTKKVNPFRLLVNNCDHDETFEIQIHTYNNEVKSVYNSTSLYRIKTITKPSVIQQLKMKNGIISWNKPIYTSFNNIIYELIDVDDVEEKTIYSTNQCNINIIKLYQNIQDIQDKQWRIRIKDIKYGYCSYSPVIDYNIGDVRTTRFTGAKLYDIKKLNKIKLPSLIYPKWKAPLKPKILKDINIVKLIDKGNYLVVPTTNIDLNQNQNNILSFMVFSDTHNKHSSWRFDQLPPVDIIIHCGDFTMDGRESEVVSFQKWGKFLASLHIDEQKNEKIYENYYKNIDDNDNDNDMKLNIDIRNRKYKHLICIAGNHEMTFDVNWYNELGSNATRKHKKIKPPINANNIKNIIKYSKYWTYLEDTSINLYGLNIYGSPWQPYFCNWAFQKQRGCELKNKWKLIPNSCDILITHGAPLCHGDKVFDINQLKSKKAKGDENREYIGDVELLNRIREIQNIQYHCFGHVHVGAGCSKQNNLKTTFINGASVDAGYEPVHKPIVFYSLKKGQSILV